MEITIRDVTLNDAEAIVKVLNPIIETGLYTVMDTPLTVEEERDYIRNFSKRGIFLVAERVPDGELLGFQSLEPFAAYTHAFDHVGVIGTYVALDHRRQGIASRLFEATFSAARKLGYEKIFTYIRADNPAALATYRRHGFQEVGRAHRQVKIRGAYIDEVFVEKFL